MPTIRINEFDTTTAGAYAGNEIVVYIPGKFGTELPTAGVAEAKVPELCTSVSDFTKKFGTITSTENADIGYMMAYQLLELGMHVLYEAFADDEMTAETTFTHLEDKGLYNIRFLTAGSFLSKDNIDIKVKLKTVAENRGDCIALLDHKKSLDSDDDNSNPYEPSKILELFKAEKSKFAAAFTPWCNYKSTIISNSVVALPGSYAYLAAFAQSVRSNPTWYAVAGASRGQIPGIVEPLYKYGETDASLLTSREKSAVCVNPICLIRPYGYILWGNRTLQEVGNTGSNQHEDLVASNFLNVRNLVTDIKKAMWSASRNVTFEQNSDVLWVNFKSQITPLLDQMMTGNGISGYKLIKSNKNRDGQSKKATLYATLRIIPIEAVEDFDLEIVLSDSLEITE